MSKQVKTKCAIFTLWVFLVLCGSAHAELKIDSVYPSIGKVGEALNVNITGSGFNSNTRASISLDVGHAALIMGYVDTPGNAAQVAVSGNTAYVADGVEGLQVINVSNPSAPVIIGHVKTSGTAVGVAVSGNIVYVADGSLQVINVSTPSVPTIIFTLNTSGDVHDIAISGNKAYLANGSSGLTVMDITNPARPVIIGSVDTPGTAYGVSVVDDKAYVADGSKLQVIDITNPSKPTILGSVNIGSKNVAIYGNKACVADGYSGLQIIDISDPANPSFITSVATPGVAMDVMLYGNIYSKRSVIELFQSSENCRIKANPIPICRLNGFVLSNLK